MYSVYLFTLIKFKLETAGFEVEHLLNKATLNPLLDKNKTILLMEALVALEKWHETFSC
jgi:hypothetical protein